MARLMRIKANFLWAFYPPLIRKTSVIYVPNRAYEEKVPSTTPRHIAILAAILNFAVLRRHYFLEVKALDPGCLVAFGAIAIFQLISLDGQMAVATAKAVFRW